MQKEFNITTTEFYNEYYLKSIYALIHNYNCEWEFLDLNNYKFLKPCEYRYTDFDRPNRYLQAYKNNQLGLAENILNNGMLFPFFILGSKTEQKENYIKIALGIHRIYSLISCKSIMPKFLFIYIPNKLNTSNIIYPHIQKYEKGKCINQKFPITQSGIINHFDDTGREISQGLFNLLNYKGHPIFNNEELFKQFINNPLNKNNIMYQYLKR